LAAAFAAALQSQLAPQAYCVEPSWYQQLHAPVESHCVHDESDPALPHELFTV
jgi:hypothetical protein